MASRPRLLVECRESIDLPNILASTTLHGR